MCHYKPRSSVTKSISHRPWFRYSQKKYCLQKSLGHSLLEWISAQPIHTTMSFVHRQNPRQGGTSLRKRSFLHRLQDYNIWTAGLLQKYWTLRMEVDLVLQMFVQSNMAWLGRLWHTPCSYWMLNYLFQLCHWTLTSSVSNLCPRTLAIPCQEM